MDCHFVYILSDSRSDALQVGLARDLLRLHGEAAARARRLVYYEVVDDAESACRRERQLRRWRRERRGELVASMNPQWDDLGAKW